jgi:hypothetical protein
MRETRGTQTTVVRSDYVHADGSSTAFANRASVDPGPDRCVSPRTPNMYIAGTTL